MNSIFKTYLVTGTIVCILFTIAALNGWQIPSFDPSRNSSSTRSRSSSFFPSSGSTSGRSSGGSWGGGK